MLYFSNCNYNLFFQCDSIRTKVEVLSVVNGYCYLLKNKDLMESLENLLLGNHFCGPYLNHVRDIKMENMYLAIFKANIKGRVKVMYLIDEFQVKYCICV